MQNKRSFHSVLVDLLVVFGALFDTTLRKVLPFDGDASKVIVV